MVLQMEKISHSNLNFFIQTKLRKTYAMHHLYLFGLGRIFNIFQYLFHQHHF
jgi:hypothetical protein